MQQLRRASTIMDKNKVLEKIDFVLLKRGGEEHIKKVLEAVKFFVESQTGFDYYSTMEYIHSEMSGKMGGVYMYADKALEFLKNELKAEKKKEKK